MIQAKDFWTFIRIYSLFKNERSSANIKLTFHKEMIKSVMTYACPAWELATDTYLLKMQRLQNKSFRTIRNFPRCTSVRDLHTALNLLMYTIIQQNCAGDKQKSYKIMRMSMFAV
jgi:hypothetical protein